MACVGVIHVAGHQKQNDMAGNCYWMLNGSLPAVMREKKSDAEV